MFHPTRPAAVPGSNIGRGVLPSTSGGQYSWQTNTVQTQYSWQTNTVQTQYSWQTNTVQLTDKYSTDGRRTQYRYSTAGKPRSVFSKYPNWGTWKTHSQRLKLQSGVTYLPISYPYYHINWPQKFNLSIQMHFMVISIVW